MTAPPAIPCGVLRSSAFCRATSSPQNRRRSGYAAILTKNDVIDLAVLPSRVTERRAEPLVADRAPTTNPTLDVVEKAYILWVLQSEGGNKSRAAEALGIDPSTLYRKLSRYGVDV